MKLRVAIAQIATLPAYRTPRVNYLVEPAPPTSNTKSYLSPLRAKPGVATFMQASAAAHLRDLETKLRRIAAHCTHHKVDLLVLPEYSVPRELLTVAREISATGDFAVVAGTHSVSNEEKALREYRELGFGFIADHPMTYVRMAMAPIFLPGDQGAWWFKQFKSKWESDLVTFGGVNKPIALDLGGQTCVVEPKICIDALASTQHAPEANLLVVVAHTPSVAPFEDLFSVKVLAEVACVIANTAEVGGSGFFAAPAAGGSAYDDLLRVSTADEIVITADLDLDEQFQKKGSIRSPAPAEIVARAPVLHELVPDQADSFDYIVSVRSGLLSPQAIEIRRLAAKADTPAALRTQFNLLAEALDDGSANDRDVELLLDCIDLPTSCVPFWNRCQQALEEGNRLVARHLGDSPGDKRLMEALRSVGDGLKATKGRSFRLAELAPVIHDLNPVVAAPSERVNKFETPGEGNYCSSITLRVLSSGGLIQTSRGRRATVGAPFTKRSGLAA